jgi:two-component system response regulator YesN
LGRDINRQQQQGELIFRVCEYLKQNYKNDITLNKLADRFYVSPPYLSRRFREKTGITLMQYLEDIRMEKAKEYLDQLRTPVTKVSEQVGYTDSSYFAKVFKKKYRISPTDYRQRGN